MGIVRAGYCGRGDQVVSCHLSQGMDKRGGPSLWGSLNPTGGHKYEQGKSSKVPKPYESGRRLWLAGNRSRRCVSGVQGSSASQAWGREGLSMVTHPGQVG